ncbi:hypothetical protein JWG39_04160 [Desulforhopalus vacuolatus]|uniref:hypothetical protein n=1 Tax=Desulforhopalus vacuolatus TaxID=40414 RepID=UPI001966A6C1|nr:hypothetical protein [Desulforhopalus vacuolatus]MBM9519009.1 hypothetical protein [Desulforhopalus vacuolatus]
MKSEGFETVRVQTRSGVTIKVHARYYRQACHRRNDKRHKGMYTGLILLGIQRRGSAADDWYSLHTPKYQPDLTATKQLPILFWINEFYNLKDWEVKTGGWERV